MLSADHQRTDFMPSIKLVCTLKYSNRCVIGLGGEALYQGETNWTKHPIQAVSRIQKPQSSLSHVRLLVRNCSCRIKSRSCFSCILTRAPKQCSDAPGLCLAKASFFKVGINENKLAKGRREKGRNNSNKQGTMRALCKD
jgi:hypothetical protein